MSRNAELVCIVDDDDSVRRALGRVVRSYGYDVQIFASGQDCLDGHEIDQASCLITDVMMPGMDGFELHALLKASDRDIPTVFISAHNDERNSALAKAASGVELLDKTRVLDSLQDAILVAIAK